jgi:hypothetical protein
MINGNVSGFDSSVVSVQGGTIGANLGVLNSAVATFSAGTVTGDAVAENVGMLAVSGTAFIGGNVESKNSSTVTLAGGGVGGGASALNAATLNISGSAVIAGNLDSDNASTVNVAGGQVGGIVFAKENSKLNVSDNAFLPGGVIGSGAAAIKITGGGVGAGGLAVAVQVQNDSTLELSGGFIAGKLRALHGSSVAILGGSVGSIELRGDTSTAGFTMGGGQILGDALAFEKGGILLVAGTVGGVVQARDNTSLVLEGTAAISGEMRGFNFSAIEMTGGSVGGNLVAQDNATIRLSGGSVFGVLAGMGHSTVEVSGSPSVGGVQLGENCNFRVVGGAFLVPPHAAAGSLLSAGGKLQAAAPGEPPRVTVSDGATISIFGGGLVATLVDPNFEGMFSRYQLSGLLSDGDIDRRWLLLIQNGSQATYHLVPWRQLASRLGWKLGIGRKLGFGDRPRRSRSIRPIPRCRHRSQLAG